MFGGNPENGLNGDAMDVEEDIDIAEPASGPIFGAPAPEKKEDTSTASTPAVSTPILDSNSMNKSVVGLWNTTPAGGATPTAISGAATPVEGGDNEKKRKREKTKERAAKKQKGMYERRRITQSYGTLANTSRTQIRAFHQLRRSGRYREGY